MSNLPDPTGIKFSKLYNTEYYGGDVNKLIGEDSQLKNIAAVVYGSCRSFTEGEGTKNERHWRRFHIQTNNKFYSVFALDSTGESEPEHGEVVVLEIQDGDSDGDEETVLVGYVASTPEKDDA